MMALLVSDEAFIGKFQDFGEDSPLVKTNSSFFENLSGSSVISENCDFIFEDCRSYEDRVHLLSKYFPLPDELLSYFNHVERYHKCASVSSSLRERSNGYFRDRNFVEALRGYNLALCFAPIGSPEVGLAFANRSAIFMESAQLEDLNHCLEDIQLALNHGYPQNLKQKLDLRREKCLRKIAKTRLEAASPTKSTEVLHYRQNTLFKLQHPNSQLPAAEDFVLVSKHPVRGRELVVTKDVRPGTTLVVDTPFVQILKNPLEWDMEHCHNCLKRISGGVPCSSCVFAVYCGASCRNDAWTNFHELECSMWPYLRLNQTPRFVLLALRIILKLGPTGTASLFRNIDGLRPEGENNSSGYSTIYDLVSHDESQSKIQQLSNVLQSLILVTLLGERTQFFTQLEPKLDLVKFRPWLTALVLHHLQNVPCNSLSLDELKLRGEPGDPIDPEAIRKAEFVQFGAGVFGTISLLNHSCNPNVTRLTSSGTGGQVSIVSLKGLKAGETLFTSYTKSFQDPLPERCQYLKDNYHFDCACEACVENWPLLSHLLSMDQEPSFLCKNCVKPLRNWHCKSCKRKENPKKIVAEYEKVVNEFFNSYELVIKNKPIEAITAVRPAVEYFQTRVVGPFGKAFMAQDTLRRALEVITYFH